MLIGFKTVMNMFYVKQLTLFISRVKHGARTKMHLGHVSHKEGTEFLKN